MPTVGSACFSAPSQYEQLENAMKDENSIYREKYLEIRNRNLHKMIPIPVCKIDNKLKNS